MDLLENLEPARRLTAMKLFHPTPVEDLNFVLHMLVTGAQAILQGQFIGAYLQGSFAHGGWDIHSDVDFLVAVEQAVTGSNEQRLQALHERAFDLTIPWAQHLEGSYFPKNLLRKEDPKRTPLLYIDNNSRTLESSNPDNTLVMRWVVREYGISMAGPDPHLLIDPVPVDDLCREVRDTMFEWGEEILTGKYVFNNRWAQPFVVISYCRMLQTLATGRVESKQSGVDWALETLDARWADLIRRAWEDRPDPSSKIRLPADPGDIELARAFIDYSLQRSASSL